MMNRSASLAFSRELSEASHVPMNDSGAFEAKLSYAAGLAAYALFSGDITTSQHARLTQSICSARESRLAMLKINSRVAA